MKKIRSGNNRNSKSSSKRKINVLKISKRRRKNGKKFTLKQRGGAGHLDRAIQKNFVDIGVNESFNDIINNIKNKLIRIYNNNTEANALKYKITTINGTIIDDQFTKDFLDLIKLKLNKTSLSKILKYLKYYLSNIKAPTTKFKGNVDINTKDELKKNELHMFDLRKLENQKFEIIYNLLTKLHSDLLKIEKNEQPLYFTKLSTSITPQKAIDMTRAPNPQPTSTSNSAEAAATKKEKERQIKEAEEERERQRQAAAAERQRQEAEEAAEEAQRKAADTSSSKCASGEEEIIVSASNETGQKICLQPLILDNHYFINEIADADNKIIHLTETITIIPCYEKWLKGLGQLTSSNNQNSLYKINFKKESTSDMYKIEQSYKDNVKDTPVIIKITTTYENVAMNVATALYKNFGKYPLYLRKSETERDLSFPVIFANPIPNP